MPTTVIGCASKDAARKHVIEFGTDRKTILIGKMNGIVLDNETADWNAVRYLVIATSADVNGPFDPTDP